MATVLLIEDDEQIAASVAKVLRQQGQEVEIAEHGSVGLARLNAAAPDVVVLDLGLPDLDGTDVLKMIRSITDVPVIITTARDDEPTIVRALDLGADEYVVKPFSGEQLDARIRAVLRRGRMQAPKRVTIGELRVDIGAHEATLGGRTLGLRPREFELLAYLAKRAGELVSRDEIAREVWNDRSRRPARRSTCTSRRCAVSSGDSGRAHVPARRSWRRRQARFPRLGAVSRRLVPCRLHRQRKPPGGDPARRRRRSDPSRRAGRGRLRRHSDREVREDGGVVVYVPNNGPFEQASEYVVRLEAPASVLRGNLRRFFIALGISTILAVALAGVVEVFAARSISRPTKRLTSAARRLQAGNLDTRVEESGPTELRELGPTLNVLAARINELLEEERESVADLAHRLCTLVTALHLEIEAPPGSEGHSSCARGYSDSRPRSARSSMRCALGRPRRTPGPDRTWLKSCA